MATITLKNIPAGIHRALKKRAELNGRSLSREIMACLESAVQPRRLNISEFLADVQALRRETKGELSEDILRQSRSEGRP